MQKPKKVWVRRLVLREVMQESSRSQRNDGTVSLSHLNSGMEIKLTFVLLHECAENIN